MTRLWPRGEAVEVWGRGELPKGFIWLGTPYRILEACNCWRVHTRWWEVDEALWREYVKVTTDAGLLCLLYRDLLEGGWFLARVYD
jgi:hypothetical protein